jgi:hypothetical protein
MRTLSIAVAALALLTPFAVAGETCDCANMCPLAKQANQLRSTGNEAVLASKVVQQHEIARVVRNLSRV